jgi:Rne/Rng family ribonuclease
LHQEPPLVLKLARDWLQANTSNNNLKIIVDDSELLTKIKTFLTSTFSTPSAKTLTPALESDLSSDLSQILHLHLPQQPLFAYYKIEREIATALARMVPLPSGASLIFDFTEALTVIDVNSGGFVGNSSAPDNETTICNTNLEAVPIIARQIRLRNLAGIIVIDFISMREKQYQARILTALAAALAFDPTIQVGSFSRFGLVDIGRKRIGPPLAQQWH